MVFELIPFLACTTAAGALGTGAWYIAVKEQKPNDKKNDKKNRVDRVDCSDKAEIESIPIQETKFLNPQVAIPQCGVGIELARLATGVYTIKSTTSDLGERGISRGDIITKIDSIDPTGMATEQVHLLMLGPRDSVVELEVRSVSSGRFVSLVLERAVSPIAATAAQSRSLYAPVPRFTPRTTN